MPTLGRLDEKIRALEEGMFSVMAECFLPENHFETVTTTAAILDGEWYMCRACGHKLARRVQGHVCTPEDTDLKTRARHPQDAAPTYELEIKCKHKSQGKYCDTLNILAVGG